MSGVPYIGELNGIKTLFVHEKPFLVLGGEIHNSSSSDLNYMEEMVWPALKGLNLNTVILPVAWETVEVQEGVFDFAAVDGLIAQARREKMKLVILWFGLWKNSESYYVPMWVKQDIRTYYRAEDAKGGRIYTISPFCDAAVEKDAHAFSQLMSHIKEVDEQENTVIMVQVENEIGVMGTERDFSPRTEEIYRRAVPEEIKALYEGDSRFPANPEGSSWEEVFGEDASELFMAWGYANAIERIAKAGQSVYGLPMYVNAWLEQHPWRPGTYPCGGPIMKVKKMWKHCAPSLFTMSPDIYVSYVADILDTYTAEDNPLFVPEIRKDPGAVSYLLYAFGKNHAIGVAPFGIEDINTDPEKLLLPPPAVLAALNIDAAAMSGSQTGPYLAATYDLIDQMKPLYFQYRGTSHMQAFVKRSDTDAGIMLSFDKYDMVVSYTSKEQGKPVASGIIFELSRDRFLLTGMSYSVKIYPKLGSRSEVAIGKIEEGRVENGVFAAERTLNGDERMHFVLKGMPGAIQIEMYDV